MGDFNGFTDYRNKENLQIRIQHLFKQRDLNNKASLNEES